MKQTVQTLLTEIRKAATEAPRMYFAPLIGAVRGIRSQYREINAPRRQNAGKIRNESGSD